MEATELIVSAISPDFASREQTIPLRDLGKDLHLLLTTEDTAPVAWTRLEGRGRVFYTTLGSTAETWKDENFRALLFGAIRWTTRKDEAGILPPAPR
jgi:type 1 glutamine amidotransferase